MRNTALNLVVALLLAVLLLAAWAWWNVEHEVFRQPSEVNGVVLVTVDRGGVARMRFEGNKSVQTAQDMEDPMNLISPYFRAMAALTAYVPPSPGSIMVVGSGGGTMCAWWSRAFADALVSGVDYDPVVVRAAREVFENRDSWRLKFIVADGRDVVAHAVPKAFGLIVLDAFGADDYPSHLVTVEFFAQVLAALRDDGVVMANLLGPSHNKQYARMVATFIAVFPHVAVVKVPERDQYVLVASRQSLRARPRLDPPHYPALNSYRTVAVGVASFPAEPLRDGEAR